MNLRHLFGITVLGVLFFSSCNNDDDVAPVSAPTISNLEVGYDNNKTATIGGDLHIDAQIVAPGGIAEIEVHLHPEGGSGSDIEAKFTYNGEKNTKFHEHVEIPDNAVAGEYHMHLKVKDQGGREAEVDTDVMIQERAMPTITNLVIGDNNNGTASVGGSLHLEAMINAPSGINKIMIELHHEGGAGDDIEVEFTEHSGKTTLDFHEDISIPATAATGDYHLHFKVLDQEGNEGEADGDVSIQ